jgi:hypothetical protein
MGVGPAHRCKRDSRGLAAQAIPAISRAHDSPRRTTSPLMVRAVRDRLRECAGMTPERPTRSAFRRVVDPRDYACPVVHDQVSKGETGDTGAVSDVELPANVKDPDDLSEESAPFRGHRDNVIDFAGCRKRRAVLDDACDLTWSKARMSRACDRHAVLRVIAASLSMRTAPSAPTPDMLRTVIARTLPGGACRNARGVPPSTGPACSA